MGNIIDLKIINPYLSSSEAVPSLLQSESEEDNKSTSVLGITQVTVLDAGRKSTSPWIPKAWAAAQTLKRNKQIFVTIHFFLNSLRNFNFCSNWHFVNLDEIFSRNRHFSSINKLKQMLNSNVRQTKSEIL